MVNDTNKSSRDPKQQWSTLQSKALMTSNSNGQRYNQNISRYCLTSTSIMVDNITNHNNTTMIWQTVAPILAIMLRSVLCFFFYCQTSSNCSNLLILSVQNESYSKIISVAKTTSSNGRQYRVHKPTSHITYIRLGRTLLPVAKNKKINASISRVCLI